MVGVALALPNGVSLYVYMSVCSSAGASDLCQDYYCSDHEFCGVAYSGEPYCSCRAIFAKPYKESRSYGMFHKALQKLFLLTDH